MMSMRRRMLRAALMDARVYEEVEADPGAMRQAVAVVLLASLADAIGLSRLGMLDLRSLIAGVLAALAGWITWAVLTYLIGTRLLPTPETRADVGELMRTLAFASTPGLLRVLGLIPSLGVPIYIFATLWMLVTMVVAVRQALDYRSTVRAVGVCVAGWTLSLAMVGVIGLLFAPRVS